MAGTGTKDDPWVLKTPPGTSDYTMYKDEDSDPPRMSVRSARRRSTMMCAPSTTFTRCSSSAAIGWSLALPTSRRKPKGHGRGVGTLGG